MDNGATASAEHTRDSNVEDGDAALLNALVDDICDRIRRQQQRQLASSHHSPPTADEADPTPTTLDIDGRGHFMASKHTRRWTDLLRKPLRRKQERRSMFHHRRRLMRKNNPPPPTSTLRSLTLRNVQFAARDTVTLLVPTIRHLQSLVSLEIDDCDDEQGQLINSLSIACISNPNITTLHIRGMDWTAEGAAVTADDGAGDGAGDGSTNDGTSAAARTREEQQGEEVIPDDDNHGYYTTNTDEVSSLNSDIIRGLGFLMTSATNVVEMHLCHNRMDRFVATSLANGLKYNTTLQILNLTGNGIDDTMLAIIVKQGFMAGRGGGEVSRKKNKRQEGGSVLHYLSLDFNSVGDVGMGHLSDWIASTDCPLEELHLFGNRLTGRGIEASLCPALTTNTALHTLILAFNQLGDRGATALASTLTVNTTVRTLKIPSTGVGRIGLQAWADQLPSMNGLQRLQFGLVLEEDLAEEIGRSLAHNVHLCELEMETASSTVAAAMAEMEMEQQEQEGSEGIEVGAYGGQPHLSQYQRDIDFYLRLNRSGRKFLRTHERQQHQSDLHDDDDHTTTNVTNGTKDPNDASKRKPTTRSKGVWSHVLSHAGGEQSRCPVKGTPDVLYHLLREKPDLFT